MKIDEKLVAKLENLSMVEIEDKPKMAENLENIVSFVEMLNELNTENIEAGSILKNSTPLREDKIKNSGIINDVLSHAPKTKDGFFIVPKIIE